MDEDLLELTDAEWSEIKQAAVELDLIHGGYFRVRTRSILFFCSPENAPEGWSLDFTDGSPELPRAVVGQVEVAGPSGEKHLLVRFRVSNWTAVRDVKTAFQRGDYRGRFQDYVQAQEEALRGRREDREWLLRQFTRLRTHASGALLESG